MCLTSNPTAECAWSTTNLAIFYSPICLLSRIRDKALKK
jgi:hypothetical protein